MVERLQDNPKANAPDISEKTYDLDDDKQRQDYMMARLENPDTEFVDVPADEAA